jgi:hypothetical protein
MMIGKTDTRTGTSRVLSGAVILLALIALNGLSALAAQPKSQGQAAHHPRDDQ